MDIEAVTESMWQHTLRRSYFPAEWKAGLVGTRSPDFGICRNPIDPAFIAGGSSSGSAVAVATGMVPVALGTGTTTSSSRASRTSCA